MICVIVSCHPWAPRIVIFTHQPSPSSKMDHFFPSGIFPGLSDSFSFHQLLKLLPRKQKMTSPRIHKAILCPENNNPGRSGFPVLQGQVKPHSVFRCEGVTHWNNFHRSHPKENSVFREFLAQHDGSRSKSKEKCFEPLQKSLAKRSLKTPNFLLVFSFLQSYMRDCYVLMQRGCAAQVSLYSVFLVSLFKNF